MIKWFPLLSRSVFFGMVLWILCAAAPAQAGGSICTPERVRSIVRPSVHIETVTHADAKDEAPAHCSVEGYIDSGTRIGFTLGLPDKWNRKFLFFGVGGFAGIPGPLFKGLARGYATASTDTGHKAASFSDATWALNNPAGVINHYEKAVNLSANITKALTTAYYGSIPEHSYFQGCSGGGRQAIVEAERFPDAFDGVISEAPAWDYSKLFITFVENAKQILKSSDNWIPPEAFPAIDRVVMRQCDTKDGIEDGLISDPRVCKPDLRELRCQTGERSSNCLTPAQLSTIDKLIKPDFARGRPGYFGFYLTGADRSDQWLGWPDWFFGKTPPQLDSTGRLQFAGDPNGLAPQDGAGPNQFALGEQFLRNVVENDSSFDARNFDIGRDEKRVENLVGHLVNADSTDLGRFVRTGGKLLIWHGWSDAAIPPEMGIDLYERIVRDTVPHRGEPPLADSVRLFMIPGLQHCGAAQDFDYGAGLTLFDPLVAMENWVEKGEAPARIVATQRVDGKLTRSRPLCPYPTASHYRGAGNSDDANNFDCR